MCAKMSSFALNATVMAERFVREVMVKRDASHDFAHAFRVRNLAINLAKEERLPDSSLEIIELAALLHDVDDHKYSHESEEKNRVETFLTTQGIAQAKSAAILSIIQSMGFKEELSGKAGNESRELAVVQDADRLDAMGAIGIARCFTYGGSRNSVLHDPSVLPILEGLTKEEYARKDRQQTMINHFYEKLLKLKNLMKTQAGKRRAEERHAFMENFLSQFHREWEGEV